MGCSQVFKANFLSPIPPGLKGSSRTSHLGDKHRPVFAEQTMVPFQPVPGRQAGQGAASDSGPRFWAGQGRRQTAFIRCRKKIVRSEELDREPLAGNHKAREACSQEA